MVDHSSDPNPRARAGQVNSRRASPGETARPKPADPDLDVAGPSAGERVAKALARAGVASRREIERLIEAGRVAINGQVLTTPAVKVGPADILTVDGKVISEAEPTRLWRYHKPAGLMTTHNDPQGRPTVFEALPEGMPRVISVGRLDLNSEGLILLTNDGSLARGLELPNNGWVRRYRARARGRVDQTRLDRLKDGVVVEGVQYGPINATLDKVKETEGKGPANIWISVALTEGKNREVRRVLESLGLKVNRLLRLSYGPFQLGTLGVGDLEEVGPRVIREQLSDFIAPAAMPKGDRVAPAPKLEAAPASGRRRADGTTPAAPGAAKVGFKARKPAEPREVMTYKPGWAKPKRKPVPAKKAAAGGGKPRRSGRAKVA